MDTTTTLLVVGAAAPAAAVVILVAARSRRERSLEPVRLGPSWTPQPPDDDAGDRAAVPADTEGRARTVEQRTGLDRETIDIVLNAWDEYLAVIGLVSLPATHHYAVYDPYDPPVPERGPDGPIPDPARVARDVSYRTRVAEVDATTVFEALDEPGAAEPGTE